ncbi:MAG TPA: SDR family oxidoreductase [Sphingobacteriaceae bacterium]
MDNTKSISVIGCGWLGFPLAKSLLNKGYTVKGSTTSNDKLPVLLEEGIEPFLVQFPDNCSVGTILNLLKSDILIIAVPPGRNSHKNQSYFGLLNTLTEALPDSSIKKIIFISSTSVYGDSNGIVNESTTPIPDNDAGKRMLTAEQIILNTDVEHVIVRLAGLIGPGRHPGKFLAGKTGVLNGLAPVNLIHLDDVIGILNAIITDENSSGIYNATAPHHPTRQEFYTSAAQSLGLDPPQFILEKASWKKVNSIRVTEELNYKFAVPNLMKWLTVH